MLSLKSGMESMVQGRECMHITREKPCICLASDSRAHTVLLTASMCSLVFRMVSRRSRLAMMPLSLSYQSSFVEHNILAIAILLNIH